MMAPCSEQWYKHQYAHWRVHSLGCCLCAVFPLSRLMEAWSQAACSAPRSMAVSAVVRVTQRSLPPGGLFQLVDARHGSAALPWTCPVQLEGYAQYIRYSSCTHSPCDVSACNTHSVCDVRVMQVVRSAWCPQTQRFKFFVGVSIDVVAATGTVKVRVRVSLMVGRVQ